MKKCKNCGREMIDVAKFCPKCGTPQLAEKRTDVAQHENMTKKEMIPNVVTASKKSKAIAILGIAITIFSVFSPVIVISGFRYMVLTLVDFSGLLSMMVLTSCGVAAFGILRKKYELITIMSNGLMLYFIMIIGIYLRVVSQSVMVFLDIVIGGFIFFFGILIMGIGGVLCGLSYNSDESRGFVSQWFFDSKKPIVLYMQSFSGLLVSVALGVLLVMLTFTAEILRS